MKPAAEIDKEDCPYQVSVFVSGGPDQRKYGAVMDISPEKFDKLNAEQIGVIAQQVGLSAYQSFMDSVL
jgi:hypothetical protein